MTLAEFDKYAKEHNLFICTTNILEQIREDIADLDDAEYDFEGYYKAVNDALQIIDKYTEQEPCDDAVSREACLMCLTGEFIPDKGYKPEELIAVFSKRIKQLPPVRPQEPKTGHWIKCKNDYECSECGGRNGWHYDYCHDCGAKMVEPKERSDKE